MIEEIKEEFKKVPNKAELYRLLSAKYGNQKEAIRINWFLNWKVPKSKQTEILEIIKEQNKK